jgi:predicted secreted Zn-dependent protease
MIQRAAPIAFALLAGGCARSTSGFLNLGSMPNGVSMDAQVHYYDVSAATLGELRRNMVVLGPRAEGRPWTAVTQTTFRWLYQYDRAITGCSLKEVKVQLRTNITFPRWNPTAEPDSAVLEWWQQMNAGLMEHERGHAMISVKAAGEIRRELEGLGAGSCEVLGQLASVRANRHISAQRQEQVEYDRNTRHGATQIEQAGRLRTP